MRFLHASFEHFRNIQLVRISLAGNGIFLVGPNGQGKSNFLECLGLVTALRSFRTADARHLIQEGEQTARAVYKVEKMRGETTEIELTIARGRKKLILDGVPVSRLNDFIGRFPVVALASEDLQLLRGAPGLRRRFLDLTLAAVSPEYFRHLRVYNQTLQQRNHLLKQRASDTELAAFEAALAPAATALATARQTWLPVIENHLERAYANLCGGLEAPSLGLSASFPRMRTEAEMVEFLREQRARDRLAGSTRKGPHREDLAISLDGRPAREYASDGQQRGLVLALRLAQQALFRESAKTEPVIIADDILNELDPERQDRFWSGLKDETQVIATGTRPPGTAHARKWRIFEVLSGCFSEWEGVPGAQPFGRAGAEG